MRITYELNEKEIRQILENHFGGYDSQIFADRNDAGNVVAHVRVTDKEER